MTMNPSFMHSIGRLNKTPKLIVISPAKNLPAYFGESSPVVKGLAFVLSTCLSISLSAKSFMIQPAERQDNAPTENNPSMYGDGIKPGDPRAKPQKHGSKSKCVPIYFCTLASLK